MIKFILIGFICSFILIYLKNSKSDFYEIAIISTSCLLIFMSFDYVGQVLEILNKLFHLSGISSEHYKIIIKIVALSYLIEFSSSLVEDMGQKNISNKLVFVGKIAILIVAFPVIYSIFNILSEIVL